MAGTGRCRRRRAVLARGLVAVSTRSQVFEHLAMARNPALSEKPGFFLVKNLLIRHLPGFPEFREEKTWSPRRIILQTG